MGSLGAIFGALGAVLGSLGALLDCLGLSWAFPGLFCGLLELPRELKNKLNASFRLHKIWGRDYMFPDDQDWPKPGLKTGPRQGSDDQ